jgi:phenylpyruvate tautomerase PptA (4-oxalocrotonate tautomerase family)
MKNAQPPAGISFNGVVRARLAHKLGVAGGRGHTLLGMPMIDLIFPEGALSEEALDGLADSLMRALLRSEHVPDDNAARELVSWVHAHELPAGRMFAGARRLRAGEPFFRLDISIPAGVVDADDKSSFIAEATRLVLEAAGVDPGDGDAAARVWVLYREIPGGWGASGRLLSNRQIAKIVGATEEQIASAAVIG